MSDLKNIPAFPIDIRLVELESYDVAMRIGSGMTLRDYFAAKAMVVILADQVQEGDTAEEHGRLAASVAYFMADAMLAERSK